MNVTNNKPLSFKAELIFGPKAVNKLLKEKENTDIDPDTYKEFKRPEDYFAKLAVVFNAVTGHIEGKAIINADDQHRGTSLVYEKKNGGRYSSEKYYDSIIDLSSFLKNGKFDLKKGIRVIVNKLASYENENPMMCLDNQKYNQKSYQKNHEKFYSIYNALSKVVFGSEAIDDWINKSKNYTDEEGIPYFTEDANYKNFSLDSKFFSEKFDDSSQSMSEEKFYAGLDDFFKKPVLCKNEWVK